MNNSRQGETRRGTPDFSLVFPAYNPGARLEQTLAELAAFAKSASETWEYVFVLDGCKDGSAELISRWTLPQAQVRVVNYFPNRGKGFAVRQGLLAAAAPFRIFTDVDLAYSFDDIRRVSRALLAGKGVAIASRTHPDSVAQLPTRMFGYAWKRYVQSELFNVITHALLPIRQKDTQAGLKGFSAEIVRRIVPRLTCDGFGIDCEILTACGRLGIGVSEVPVCVRYDDVGSTTSLRSTLAMVRDLWRVRRAWPATVAREAAPARYREAG